MKNPPVRSIMSQPVLAVSPRMQAWEALRFALTHQVHHLPVADGGPPLGLICTCDLRQADTQQSVSALMTRPALGVDAETPGLEAIAAMNEHKIGSLLVFDSGRIVGIVTRDDLERAELPVRQDGAGLLSLLR